MSCCSSSGASRLPPTRALQELADKLRKEEREGGRNRKWRANFNRLNAQLVALENDQDNLERVHPQVQPRVY